LINWSLPMLLSQQLTEYVSACFTGLWVQSHEHEDALAEIAQLCRQEEWRLAVWDIEQGLQIPGQAEDAASESGGADPLAAIRSINALATPDRKAAEARTSRGTPRQNGIFDSN
jgi:hypothetical protein